MSELEQAMVELISFLRRRYPLLSGEDIVYLAVELVRLKLGTGQ